MNNNEAIKIIKNAIGYSTKENAARNMSNAIGCFAELNGWTKECAPTKFIALCLKGAEDYKNNPMNNYILKDANDASNISLYIDNQAAKDINEQRNSKK